MRRRACIDIGSNTTRLLVADCGEDGELEIVREERILNRIVQSAGPDGQLGAAKVAELVASVRDQRGIALHSGAIDIVCVATAGLRRLSNRAMIARLISGACGGLEVRILDPEEEAAYSFAGAAWASGASGSSEPLAVVDVGGGSTELVVGVPRAGVSWSRSIALGSGDGRRLGLRSDPPTAGELAHARELVRAQLLSELAPPVARAVAVGGSAGTLQRIVEEPLDAQSLERVMAQLVSSDAPRFARRQQLEVDRVRMLPAGLLLLGAASELFGVALEVVAGGLREGVLLADGGAHQ